METVKNKVLIRVNHLSAVYYYGLTVLALSVGVALFGQVHQVFALPSNTGATLPITYSAASVPSSAKYVATNGTNNASCSNASPCKTLAYAISRTGSNGTIVIRGGVYREGDISVDKTLTIQAYPGELPEFRGSKKYNAGSYTPQPVTDGHGISFSTGQNLTGDGVGKYPDQAWVGTKQLRQVTSKSSLTSETFYVDRSAKRLYVHSSIDTNSVEVSDKDVFMKITAPNVRLKGLKITRYSNSADDYGVINITGSADSSLLEDIYISDSAFLGVQYQGNSNLNKNGIMRRVTLTTSNWMGVGALYTDNLTLDAVSFTKMNQFGEFRTSPQSGALKTSRARYTKVVNSNISDNNGHGLWFDQSNYDVDVANNRIVNNAGSGVFFEISDDLLLINNYIRAKGSARALKLSGSSGLKLINNTIIGGADSVGVYVDPRSKPGCAKPGGTKCPTEYSSDTDTVRPWINTIDWMPRIDLMINNIIAYPTGSGYCGVNPTTVCIMSKNDGAVIPIESVIHKADSRRGIPQTYIDGNVYANSGRTIINTEIGKFTTTTGFSNKMAGSPVNIAGLEASGKVGNQYVATDGSATTALNHDEAVAIPANSNINAYLPAGTKHYGVLGVNNYINDVPSQGSDTTDSGTDDTSLPSDPSNAGSVLPDPIDDYVDPSLAACTDNNCGLFVKYINPLVAFLSGFVGLAVTIGIIVSGIQYATAGADASKTSAAKVRLRNAIFALIAYLFLFGLMQWLVPGGLI